MIDTPPDGIEEFMADLRAWASSSHGFAQELHALSLEQRSRAAELRVEAQEILHQVRSRRQSEHEGRDLRRHRSGA